MLNRLFKPKWQHKNSVIRQQAIEKLNPADTEEHKILIEAALKDTDDTVRAAAIENLEDLDTLEKLISANSSSNSAQDSTLNKTLTQRYGQLLASPPSGIKDDEIAARLQRCNNTDAINAFTQYCQDPKLLSEAILQIDDPQQLIELASQSPTAKTRKMAAELIHDEAALKQLLSASKGKDKSVSQIVKQKLNVLKEQNETHQGINLDLANTLDSLKTIEHSIQQHGDSAINSQLVAKHSVLINKLNAINEKVKSTPHQAEAKLNEERQQTQNQIEVLNSTINAKFEAKKAQLEQEAREKAEAEQSTDKQKALLSALSTWKDELAQQTSIQPEENQNKLNDFECQWQALQAQYKNSELNGQFIKTRSQIESTLSAFERWDKLAQQVDQQLTSKVKKDQLKPLRQSSKQIDKLIKQVNWPSAMAQPEALVKLTKLKSDCEQNINGLLQAQKNLRNTVEAQIKELESHIDAGQVDQASSSLTKVQNTLGKLDDSHSKGLDAELKRLKAQYNSLRDWQHYATDPKREALCEEMEKLISLDIPAPEKAKSIKALQQEWKQLGDAKNTRDLWLRFKAAADEAYAPCKEHFNLDHQKRENNFNQRQQIIEQLKQYYEGTDWNAIAKDQWQAVDKIIQQATKEWREFSPVARDKHKAQQDEFHAVLNPIKDQLRDERKRNKATKEDIISKAKSALEESENSQEAIDTVKQLQQDWKAVGITFHSDNQKLWGQFREACDAVFALRDQERDQAKSERDQNFAQAKALITELNTLSKDDGDALLAHRVRVDEIQSAYNALGELPKAKQNQCRKDFSAAIDQFKHRVATIDDRKQISKRSDLIKLIDRLYQGEHINNSDFETELANLALPEAWHKAVEKRIAAANDSIQTQDALDTLRNVCIQLEISLQVESPAEDKAKRMTMQMERLSSGFGKGGEDKDQSTALILAWLDIPLLKADAIDSEYQQLQSRFFKLIEA